MFSISHSRVTRMSSGSNRKSHCGTENCERCQVEVQGNSPIKQKSQVFQPKLSSEIIVLLHCLKIIDRYKNNVV
jgi:hypothetical protein